MRKVWYRAKEADGSRVTVYTDGSSVIHTLAGAKLRRVGNRLELLEAPPTKPSRCEPIRWTLETMQRILRIRI